MIVARRAAGRPARPWARTAAARRRSRRAARLPPRAAACGRRARATPRRARRARGSRGRWRRTSSRGRGGATRRPTGASRRSTSTRSAAGSPRPTRAALPSAGRHPVATRPATIAPSRVSRASPWNRVSAVVGSSPYGWRPTRRRRPRAAGTHEARGVIARPVAVVEAQTSGTEADELGQPVAPRRRPQRAGDGGDERVVAVIVGTRQAQQVRVRQARARGRRARRCSCLAGRAGVRRANRGRRSTIRPERRRCCW